VVNQVVYMVSGVSVEGDACTCLLRGGVVSCGGVLVLRGLIVSRRNKIACVVGSGRGETSNLLK
jgi:hypothetical protein